MSMFLIVPQMDHSDEDFAVVGLHVIANMKMEQKTFTQKFADCNNSYKLDASLKNL